MKKKSKKKQIARVIAAILIIVLAGVASYHGSKAIFTHKFRKDKEEAERKEQEELINTIQKNYVTVVRVGKLTALRIFNTEKSELTFVLMRPDSDLFTYDEEGNGENIKKVVNNIQNAYSVAANSYEDFDQTAFADFINHNDSFECDLPHAVSYKDTNKMTVHLDAGEHILNGGQAWGIISGAGEYDSQEEYMENTKAVLEGFVSMVFDDPTKESITSIADIIFDNCKSDVTADKIKNYIPLYAKLTTADVTITEFEGKETSNGFEVDIDKAKELISDITDTTKDKASTEKTTSKKSTTEKKKATTEKTTEEKETISSEGKSIYIRNAAYINGLATKWKSKLTEDGYIINSVDNFDKTYDQTIITVSEKGMGQDLKKKYFKNAKIQVGNVEDGADICIYLGKDADTL
ncbi:MAG: LytR C-terminal domain-containing protein [Lachnospiraceae bacterium]|nr:LytR C-terminal domain-containing protein [Lachnospiraceae bacterium]